MLLDPSGQGLLISSTQAQIGNSLCPFHSLVYRRWVLVGWPNRFSTAGFIIPLDLPGKQGILIPEFKNRLRPEARLRTMALADTATISPIPKILAGKAV